MAVAMKTKTITINGRSALVFQIIGRGEKEEDFVIDRDDHEAMLEVAGAITLRHGHKFKCLLINDIKAMVNQQNKLSNNPLSNNENYNDGRVRSLKLPKTQSRLLASIAPNLPKLEVLCLHHIDTLEGLLSFVGNMPNLVCLEIWDGIRRFGNRRFDFSSFPENVGNLVQLRTLSVFAAINNDHQIPSSLWKLNNLTKLKLSLRGDAFHVPDAIGALKRLEVLDFSYADILSLPSTLRNLTNLKSLNLSSTRRLTSLPEEAVGELVQLEELDIDHSGISSLSSEMMRKLKNLKKLVVRSEYLKNLLIEEIGTLSSLEAFTIGNDCKITKIPDWIGNFWHMKELNLYTMVNVNSLPNEIGNLVALESLIVHDTGIVCLPSSIGRLQNLKRLELISNENLKSLSVGVYELSKLEELTISHSQGWGHVAPKAIQQLLKKCSSLVHLDLTRCGICEIDPIRGFPKKLLRLNLDLNPIFRFYKTEANQTKVLGSTSKNLLDLLRESNILSLLGDDRLEKLEKYWCEEIRYELSVNRARHRILQGFSKEGRVMIPPALWAFLLSNAPQAFRRADHSRYWNPLNTLSKEDAIYAMLKLLGCADYIVMGGFQKNQRCNLPDRSVNDQTQQSTHQI